MTAGYSGSYSINSVSILPPTQGRWVERDLISYDGQGRPIYGAIGEFELTWQLVSVSDLKQLIDVARSSLTGTVVSDLPQWGAAGYLYYSYSGTYCNRPSVDAYFAEYVENVKVIISNVRTD